MPNVEFTPDKYKRLKIAYQKAVDANKKSFVFDANEYVTSYAKYLLEYLKGKMQVI